MRGKKGSRATGRLPARSAKSGSRSAKCEERKECSVLPARKPFKRLVIPNTFWHRLYWLNFDDGLMIREAMED